MSKKEEISSSEYENIVKHFSQMNYPEAEPSGY